MTALAICLAVYYVGALAIIVSWAWSTDWRDIDGDYEICAVVAVLWPLLLASLVLE